MHARKAQLSATVWALAVVAFVAFGLGMAGRGFTQHAQAENQSPQADAQRALADLESQLADVHAVSHAFKLVSRIARPGVVHIRVGGGMASDVDDDDVEDLRREFGGEIPREQIERWLRRVPPGSGSGIIIDEAGHILTNNHVVDGRESIRVILHDEREFEAEVVGTDAKTDLAVIRIDADEITPLRLGDSSRLEVGDWVIAVGSPFGLEQTVTHGIVSAIGRTRVAGVNIDYQDFIQTDAAINPGNSGGPLLNLRGEVVGVNTAIATHGDAFNAGIAFTIPSNMALKIADQLRARGKVERGWLGVSMVPVDEDDVGLFGLPGANGVLVSGVLRRSPADRAGLQCEDVIIEVDGQQVTDSESFRGLIADLRPHERVRMRIVRDGEQRNLTVRLGLQPDNIRAQLDEMIESRELARLGLQVRTLRSNVRLYDENIKGVVVTGIVRGPNAPDVEIGELIISCNDQPVHSVAELKKAVEGTASERVMLRVQEPSGDEKLIYVRPRGD